MDYLTMEKLRSLLESHSGWCVSLYMPTHRTDPGMEQDPIRFRNLLKEVESRLLGKGMRSPDVQGIIEPAQRLLQNPSFWQHQSAGLAMFFSQEAFHTFCLPLRFNELVVISDRFHLKPLLPFFASDGHFYILALSQNQVRVLEGTRHTVDEIAIESMPSTIAEALPFERFEKQLQFHTGTSGGGGKRSAVFHGHDISDEDKNKILRWFQKVDDELAKLIAGGHSPVVLAGVEYYFPLYHQASSYPYLLEVGIPGNPDDLRPEELHQGAWPLVQPIFEQAQESALAKYQQFAGTEKTTTDVKEAVLAANHGRMDILFVAVDVEVWGKLDPDTNTVTIHQEHEQGDADLLDLAAIQTIMNGGTVYAIVSDKMPTPAPLAALYRY